jgi:predicted dehydrogenase
VEKPLGLSVTECDEVLAEAERAGRKVVVDHTFAYHPAIRYLADQVKSGELGDLLSYDSVRVNFGGFQSGADVLWDLAPHDLSILDLITGAKDPVTVSALGRRHFNENIDNLCYVNLLYDDNFLAHLHLDWVAPVKIRTIMVTGSKKMALYDDNLPTEKVKLYDRRINVQAADANQDIRVNYKIGDMMAPAISTREALSSVISEFIDSILDEKPSVSEGKSGRRIVRILEAATQSMRKGGIPVQLG